MTDEVGLQRMLKEGAMFRSTKGDWIESEMKFKIKKQIIEKEVIK